MRDREVRRMIILDRKNKLAGVLSLGDISKVKGEEKVVGKTVGVLPRPPRRVQVSLEITSSSVSPRGVASRLSGCFPSLRLREGCAPSRSRFAPNHKNAPPARIRQPIKASKGNSPTVFGSFRCGAAPLEQTASALSGLAVSSVARWPLLRRYFVGDCVLAAGAASSGPFVS